MMWNSRVRRERLLTSGIAFFLATCTSSGTGTLSVAPDSPRPAREASALSGAQVQAGGHAAQDRPVELKAVRLRLARSDSALARMAGPQVLQRASDAVAIEVTTAESLGDVPRTSSAEIFLDGTRVGDTWPVPPNRLIVFLTDRQRLREGTSVTVAWLGDEERTRTRRPVVLTHDHFREIR